MKSDSYSKLNEWDTIDWSKSISIEKDGHDLIVGIIEDSWLEGQLFLQKDRGLSIAGFALVIPGIPPGNYLETNWGRISLKDGAQINVLYEGKPLSANFYLLESKSTGNRLLEYKKGYPSFRFEEGMLVVDTVKYYEAPYGDVREVVE